MSEHRILVSAALLGIVVLSGCTALADGSPASPDDGSTPVAVECAPHAGPLVDDSEQVSATEAAAMPEDDFWALIGTLNGTASQKGFDRLSDALAVEGVEAALAFDARLALVLYALDSECRLDWYTANDPLGLGFVSDDTFLYARCDTVIAGRKNWEAAVATDSLPWGNADPATGLGELLLYAGVTAAEQLGVDMADYWDQQFSIVQVSWETGGNPNGWPQP